MKRSALKRSTPLRRSSYLPTRRSRQRRSERVRDKGYLSAIHDLPCFASLSVEGHRCDWVIQADHQGRRGYGQKSHDRESVSLCVLGHLERETFSGPMKTWNQARMREWIAAGIAWTQAAMKRLGGEGL